MSLIELFLKIITWICVQSLEPARDVPEEDQAGPVTNITPIRFSKGKS